MSLSKRIRISETKNVEFRMDAISILKANDEIPQAAIQKILEANPKALYGLDV